MEEEEDVEAEDMGMVLMVEEKEVEDKEEVEDEGRCPLFPVAEEAWLRRSAPAEGNMVCRSPRVCPADWRKGDEELPPISSGWLMCPSRAWFMGGKLRPPLPRERPGKPAAVELRLPPCLCPRLSAILRLERCRASLMLIPTSSLNCRLWSDSVV